MTGTIKNPVPPRIRLVIWSDSTELRRSLQPRLDILGCASSGIEAMQLIDSHNPDLVLVDVRMDTMDLVETIRRLNDSRPTIKTLLRLDRKQALKYHNQLRRSGTQGICHRESSLDDLLFAIAETANASK